MSLLSDTAIKFYQRKGEFAVEPWDEARIQPSSMDVTLDNKFIMLSPNMKPMDPYDLDTYSSYAFTRESHMLKPGEFILAATIEKVTLGPRIAARVEGKSSLGRLGLLVHVTAGFVDPGFSNPITLELANLSPRPFMLTAGMPIAQLAFFHLEVPASVYGGKYAGDTTGPVTSRYYQNPRPEKKS